METIELTCGGAGAAIGLRGAQLTSWSVQGRPLLWRPDPVFWAETAPVLFPVVGWTRGGRARVGQKAYPLGLHGFAREMDFVLRAQTPGRARLTLCANEATRALYPFDFWLGLGYQLTETALTTTVTVKNRGAEPMPYACGLHPGFRWPFAGGRPEDYSIVFAKPENPFVPVISKDGLFLDARRRIPLEGTRLPLDPALFSAEALCFLDAQSRGLRFEGPGGAALCVDVSSFSHFALWSKPGAGFLSIEVWTGHGDPEGFDGDLFQKPSMRVLAPGALAHHVARYSFSI